MSDPVKIALIAAGALVLAVGLYVYFSPYQQCVRAQVEYGRKLARATYDEDFARNAARISCARNSN